MVELCDCGPLECTVHGRRTHTDFGGQEALRPVATTLEGSDFEQHVHIRGVDHASIIGYSVFAIREYRMNLVRIRYTEPERNVETTIKISALCLTAIQLRSIFHQT